MRLVIALTLILVALAAACALLPWRRLATYVSASSHGNGSNNGDCANAGVYYPENPYTSWPIPNGDWFHVTATYCDPWYYQQYGVIHWGIDLGYATGTPVIASGTAEVVRAEYGSQ